MRIFITGGTGFVGREIVRQLREEGRTIRLLVRNPGSERMQDIPGRSGIEMHVGNVLDAASLTGALEGMHAVIHLVGIIREMGESTFENVHDMGTQNILAATRDAGIERFIHMSALGVRSESVSRYHQSKWAAEEAVRQSDLDYTIFRPSLIYGPGDEFVNLFARISRYSPVLPVLADARFHFQPVPVETVARAFVRSVAEPRSMSETYDLCGPEALTMSQILDEICRALGRKRLKLQIPLAIARRQAAFLEFIYPRLFRKPAPFNRDQLIMLHEENRGNPQPANELFGLEKTPFHAGVGRCFNSNAA
jgi:NADH dehydrogenase